MTQDTLDAMTGWYEWVSWKHLDLLTSRRHELAQEFLRDVLQVMRRPVAGLVVAGKKAGEPATSTLATTRASHPIQDWLEANPDPLRETWEQMQALRERWGETIRLPKEPAG